MRVPTRRRTHLLGITLLSGLFAMSTAIQLRAGTPVPRPIVTPPKLTVIVAVDGLSWERLTVYRPWYTAGLKRLLEEGLVETNCNYRHLNTETGPGHASLGTGAPPRVHGIVGNRWYEIGRDGAMQEVYCTAQPWAPAPGAPPLFYREVAKDGAIHVFAIEWQFDEWQKGALQISMEHRPKYGPRGESVLFDSADAVHLYNLKHGKPAEPLPTGTMPGPVKLRVPTLADELVANYHTARVVSISGKDRGAIFLAGKNRRHLVYWYDHDSGRFITSGAYDVADPFGASGRKLVNDFNSSTAGRAMFDRLGTVWNRVGLPAPAQGSSSAPLPTPVPNLADFQVPVNGLGFPHDLAQNQDGYYGGVYASPFVDQLVGDLALAFINDDGFKLGRGPQPDLLALSFSAQDLVSHNYGPESEENFDLLRRLDVQLGRVLDALQAKVGKGDVALAFSADHGFATIPEAARARDKKSPGGRLVFGNRVMTDFVARANRLLDEELGLPPDAKPLRAVEGWTLYYNRTALPMKSVAGRRGPGGFPIDAAQIDAAVSRVLPFFFAEELQAVMTVSGAAQWAPGDPVTEFARNDLDPERSGDAFLVPRPGVLMHWDPGRGTGHGSQYETDTHVPLVFWGGPFAAATRTEACAPYDLAPTLAGVLGVPLSSATGHRLGPESRTTLVTTN